MRQLLETSDLVVKVTARGEREAKYRSILTAVTVDEVYKGDASLLGQKIWVYEHAEVFLFDDHYTVDTYGGTYNLMQTGAQYYLLLNFRAMPDGYEYSEQDLKTWLIVNTYYGKFSVRQNSALSPLSLEEANHLDYRKICDWDILPKTEEEIRDYTDRREDLLHLLDG